ncbi:MAG: hypothetical protein RL430_1560 [Actinomycetota bacterium]|jgi:hypothetical protein
MSYQETARAFVQAEAPNLPPYHNGTHAADKLPMSAWAESRRAGMTPETIAANHALHVADCAADLRAQVLAWAAPAFDPASPEGRFRTAARALLAAIGEEGAR